MCYRIQLNTGIKNLTKRFKAQFQFPELAVLGEEINGFEHPATPLITNEDPSLIVCDVHWGLIPHYAKDDSFRKNTLNARIETLGETAAFRDVVSNRCLVIATGYFDWRWNDDKGKSKQKHIIHSAQEEIFTFAGIWSKWRNPQTGEEVKTYSIVTTAANKTMSYVHNTKQRMPVMLRREDETSWLDKNNDYGDFAFPNYDPGLVTFEVA